LDNRNDINDLDDGNVAYNIIANEDFEFRNVRLDEFGEQRIRGADVGELDNLLDNRNDVDDHAYEPMAIDGMNVGLPAQMDNHLWDNRNDVDDNIDADMHADDDFGFLSLFFG
jgi:hypothetical protein